MVIVGSGSGETIAGGLAGKVVIVGISAWETVLVVVVGTGSGSTGVELLAGTLVEILEGTIVFVVAVNRGSVAGRLTVTGTRTGTATTDLICSLELLTLPSGFFKSEIT